LNLSLFALTHTQKHSRKLLYQPKLSIIRNSSPVIANPYTTFPLISISHVFSESNSCLKAAAKVGCFASTTNTYARCSSSSVDNMRSMTTNSSIPTVSASTAFSLYSARLFKFVFRHRRILLAPKILYLSYPTHHTLLFLLGVIFPQPACGSFMRLRILRCSLLGMSEYGVIHFILLFIVGCSVFVL